MTAKALICTLLMMLAFLGWREFWLRRSEFAHAISVWWAHRGEWRGIGRNW